MATNLRVTCLRYGVPLLSLFTLLAIAGCQSDKRLNLSSQSLSGSAMQTVVVVGFRAAITNAEAPELVRNPITGTSFMSWPVPEEVVDWLTGQLFERLTQDKNRHFIPPGQAQGVV